MEALKEALGELYEGVCEKIDGYNAAHPTAPLRLGNLGSGDYISRDKYEALRAQLDKRADPEQVKDLLRQLEDLKSESSAKEAAYEESLGRLKLGFALEKELLQAGAVDTDLVKVKLNQEQLRLGDDGSVQGLSEQLQQVKQRYGFLFASGGSGAPRFAAPAGGEGTTTLDSARSVMGLPVK